MQRKLCHIVLKYVYPATLYCCVVIQHPHCVGALGEIHCRRVARINVIDPRCKILQIIMITTTVSVTAEIQRMTAMGAAHTLDQHVQFQCM